MQLPDPQTAQAQGAGCCLLLELPQKSKELESLCTLISKMAWCPLPPSGIQDSMRVP